jgi:hypothetical protein
VDGGSEAPETFLDGFIGLLEGGRGMNLVSPRQKCFDQGASEIDKGSRRTGEEQNPHRPSNSSVAIK